jgi:hypothetical protein
VFLPDLRVHHTLTKHDDVWLTSLSRRYPQEYLEVERRVKRQGGPSLNPAPLARIEWVIWIGLGGVSGYRSKKLSGAIWQGRNWFRICVSGSDRSNTGFIDDMSFPPTIGSSSSPPYTIVNAAIIFYPVHQLPGRIHVHGVHP